MSTVMKLFFSDYMLTVCLEVEMNTVQVFGCRKMVKSCCHKICRNVRCMLDERSALSQRRLPRWRHLTVQVS